MIRVALEARDDALVERLGRQVAPVGDLLPHARVRVLGERREDHRELEVLDARPVADAPQARAHDLADGGVVVGGGRERGEELVGGHGIREGCQNLSWDGAATVPDTPTIA